MPNTPILAPADHEHFLEHGYVVVKNVAPSDAIAEALAGFEGKAYSGTVGAADYKPVRPEALPRCYGPRFAAAVAELFGEEFSIHPQFAGTHMPRVYDPEKAPEWKITGGGHIDDDYPTPMPAGWALGCFLFLTPVKTRGGGFVYYPGSYHRIRAAMTATPWASKIFSGDIGDHGVIGKGVEFFAEPGDALFFHHLMGHAGSINVADTTTRHALLSRHHPRARVVPGSKPVDQMSTIDKANSVRCLRQRFGRSFVMPNVKIDAATSRVLHDGVALKGPAVATLHFAGRAWLFSADGQRVRITSSDNWLHWRDEHTLDACDAPVEDLTLYQRENTVYLAAGSASGVAVFASDDLQTWRRVAQLPGVVGLCGHYSTDYGTKVARGYFAFTRKANENKIAARWAANFEAALTSEQSTVSYETVGADVRLAGFTTAPTLGEGEFAMVMDLVTGNAPSRPFFLRGGDSVLFNGEPTPITFAGDVPPRHIRVYHRARNYWIVTFLRTQAGEERMFWGVIDWSASPVALTQIADASALTGAMEVVGLL